MRKLVIIVATVIGAAVLSASPMSVNMTENKEALSLSQDKAFAVVGRPATPGSVAGVNRRVQRRATRPH
jgi:hypothetical protein